jgi:hypothetical protein
MKVRYVAASLLLATVAASPASADDVITLQPTCAAIDETRDTLTPEQRTAALARVSRALMDANVLVVEQGCTDPFVLSHEKDGDRSIVRLAASGVALRVADPGAHDRDRAYARLVERLLEKREEAAGEQTKQDAAQEASAPARDTVAVVEAAAADRVEPSNAPQLDVEAPYVPETGVRKDNVFYGKLLVGNYGSGVAVGVTIPLKPTLAFDVSAGGTGGDQKDMAFVGARVFGYRDPELSSSLYYGGGLSLAGQTDRGSDGSGLRLEAALGVALNRTKQTRFFLEGSAGIPLYDMTGGDGESYEPTFMLSFGVGR